MGTKMAQNNLQHANYLNRCFFYVAGFGTFGRHKILCVGPFLAPTPLSPCPRRGSCPPVTCALSCTAGARILPEPVSMPL